MKKNWGCNSAINMQEKAAKRVLEEKFPFLELAATECIRYLQNADWSEKKEIKQLLLTMWKTESVQYINLMRLYNIERPW